MPWQSLRSGFFPFFVLLQVYSGLSCYSRFIMTAFLVGSLSVIGLPPTGGFISKWFRVVGTLEANQIIMLGVLLGSSLLNAAYFLPVVYRAFFCTPEESLFEARIQEAPLWCVVPLIFTAIGSIALFFFPQPFFNLASLAVQAITGG